MDQDKLTSTASYLWPMHLGGLIDLHFMSTWLAFSNRCCCSRCCWCCFSHVSPWSNRTQQSAATAANRKPHKDKRIEPYKHASFFHVWHSETNMKYIIPNVQHNRSAEMALPVSKKNNANTSIPPSNEMNNQPNIRDGFQKSCSQNGPDNAFPSVTLLLIIKN